MIATPKTTLDPVLIRMSGILAILGSVALVLGNIWGSIMVPNHDWIADTVSDLAAGPYEIIQDVALYLYAIGLLALAIVSAHLHVGRGIWNVVVFGLALLALCVVIIAARNEYGDGDAEGIVVHIYVVYAMGVLFTAVFCAAALRGAPLGLYGVSVICGVLWTVGSPVFFLLPTAYDGAFERGLGLVTTIWVVTYAVSLIRLAGRVQ